MAIKKLNSALRKAVVKNGFSLIEVLVAVGLFAIIAVAITSFMTNGMKQQKGIQAKDQQREATSEIRTLLNNKTACLNSFGGQAPALGFTVTSLKDAAGTNRYTVGTADKTGMLKFDRIEITNWVADAGYTTQGNADLKIRFSKIGDTGTVVEIKPDVITLRLKRDAAGLLTECFSIGTQSDGFWQASPTNPSNIYYSGGNAGLGIDTPVAKLDVAGEVKFGNTSSVCNATSEGQQRYNSLTHFMEFCNGTVWKTFGLTQNIVLTSPFVNLPTSLLCPAGTLLSSCRTEISSPDGQSMHIRNQFTFVTDGAGNVVGCTAGPGMVDVAGDTYRIVLVCVK